MKLLLDMYKGVGKEMRDKTQLMAAERKARLEVDELKQQLKKIQASFMLFHPPPQFHNEVILVHVWRSLTSHFTAFTIRLETKSCRISHRKLMVKYDRT